MFGEKHDPEFLKHLFESTEILRKPVAGIIAGYHVLPYILVGPQEEKPAASVEIRGKIKVSPRLVLAPGRAGQTYARTIFCATRVPRCISLGSSPISLERGSMSDGRAN